MNFERLVKAYVENYSRFFDKFRARQIIIDEYAHLKLKKEKLKLGKITFEFKYHFYGTIPIYEEVEMIFCRQDNTEENEKKLEFILKRYA